MKKKQSAHYNEGELKKIAFLFSCPGQDEVKNEKPVSGITGKNLDTLLKKLYIGNKQIFESKYRYSYRITNSISSVLYKNEHCKRTEPTKTEIKETKNLDRLKCELNGFSIVVCFGKKAEYALSKLKELNPPIEIKSVITRHLSLQSINQIKLKITDPPLTPGSARTKARIDIIANKILCYLEKIKKNEQL